MRLDWFINDDILLNVGEGGDPLIINLIEGNYLGIERQLVTGAAMGGNFNLFVKYVHTIGADFWKNIDFGYQYTSSTILSSIISGENIKILEYVGEKIDGVVFNIDWDQAMYFSSLEGNFDMFGYSISKGANISKVLSQTMGLGGSIEIVKFVELSHSIDWNELMKGASTNEHEDLILYALFRGANNYKECIIEASKVGSLSIILLFESEMNAKNVYISTKIWNKCMISAVGDGLCSGSDDLDIMNIIEYCGNKGAYNWNRCMKEGAYNLCSEAIEYAESKGADDWEDSLSYMKEHNSDAMNYNNKRRRIMFSIQEHFKYKLGKCKRRKLQIDQ